MKKYILSGIAFFVLLVLAIVGFIVDNSNILKDNTYFVVESKKDYENIGLWHKNNEEYYVFLPSYANLDNITMSFTDKDTIIEIDNGIYSDGEKLKGIECDKEYSVQLSSKIKKEEAKIIFMKANNTGTVYIDTESGSMEEINKDKEYRESGYMKVIDSDGSINYNGALEHIKGRGNYSWMWGDKLPYNIKTEKKVNLLGMGKSKKWCLIANCFDKSNLKNKMIYDFADRIGLEYAPDAEYVDVYLNGAYSGIYLLSEKVEVANNRVEIGERSGNYLMSLLPYDRDYTSAFYTRDNNVLITVLQPEYTTKEENDYISCFVSDFENALNSNNGYNSKGKYYTDYIDTRSWSLKMIVEELFSNWDMDYASQYFYKRQNEDKLYAGPVWDYDLSTGHINGLYTELTDTNILFINEHHFDMTGWWYERLYSHSDFYDEMIYNYEHIVMPEALKLTDSVIDEMGKSIENSSMMDSIRWNYEPDENADTVKENVEGKTEFLKSLWIDKDTYHTVVLTYDCDWNEDTLTHKFGVKDNEIFSDYPDISRYGYIFKGWYDDKDKLYDKDSKITKDLSLHAVWEEDPNLRPSLIEKCIYTLKEYYEVIPLLLLLTMIPIIIVIDRKRNKVTRDEKVS